MPFHPAGLKDELCFDLRFNEYGKVIVSANKTATYKISDITLEYEKVSHPELARLIRQQYSSETVILFTRVHREKIEPFDKSQGSWNLNWNVPVKSLKGVLHSLWIAPQVLWDQTLDATANISTTHLLTRLKFRWRV